MEKIEMVREFGGIQTNVFIKFKKTNRAQASSDFRGSYLILELPEFLKGKDIEKYIERQEGWLLELREKSKDKIIENETQDTYYLNGNLLNLIKNKNAKQIEIQENAIIVPEKTTKRDIDGYIGSLFYKKFFEKTREFCKELNLEMPLFEVAYPFKNTKKAWGCYSRIGKIIINPKLAKTPEFCQDYVLAHEVCHMVYFSHTRSFWNLVKSIYQKTDEAVEWLRINQSSIE
jgi:predicted metal-dependent hydrolase